MNTSLSTEVNFRPISTYEGSFSVSDTVLTHSQGFTGSSDGGKPSHLTDDPIPCRYGTGMTYPRGELDVMSDMFRHIIGPNQDRGYVFRGLSTYRKSQNDNITRLVRTRVL